MNCETGTFKYFRKSSLIMLRKVCSLSLIAFIFLFVSCENEISKIKIYSDSEDLPSVTAEGFEMLESDSTKIRTKLQAPELIQHEDGKASYVEFPKGIKIEKYDANMNIISSVTASYAKNYSSDDRWEAKNNVVAVNLNGDTLRTEYLVLDTRKKRIYSDQLVRIVNKDVNLTGTGFESNLDFTDYSFKNPSGPMYFDIEK